MCTVTYLPKPDGDFILTSNRDEAPFRKTLPPAMHSTENPNLLYPKDTLAGGTWLCVSAENRVVCLLNGAFKSHKRQSSYRKSRGLVVLDCFSFENIQQFSETYDLSDIEPFTLVWVDTHTLFELRWDGQYQYLTEMDARQPHIWGSASLYTPEYLEKRATWFNYWLKQHHSYKAADILDFHITGGEGNVYNDIVMNRGGFVRTVSITSIERNSNSFAIAYHDLLTESVHQQELSLL